MLQVMYQRRANVWILLSLLIHTKTNPVFAAPPDLASELTVEAITTTSARVKWDQTPVGNPPTFDNYEVSISPSALCSAGITFTPGPLVTANHANPETYISGLTAGVEYTVSVRTVNGTEKGTAKTITFNTKPNPLSGSSAIRFTNVASTTATVSWTTPSGTFEEYVISVSPAGATLSPSSPVGAGTTSTSLTNLTPGTRYTVEVKTKSGESLSDAVINTFTTKPVEVRSTSIIITALTADSATLTWDPVTSGTFVDYTISISGGATVNPTTVAKGEATTTSLTNMTPGTSYTVTLKSRASGNVESDPATHTFTTKPEKVEASSLSVGNTATTTTATLTWGAVGTPFLTYEIAISPTTGGARANPASVAKGTTTTALESLTPGRLYTITIKTKIAALESDAVTFTFRTKPINCDVVVTDLSTETNKLRASFTTSTLVFTEYKFVILNGPKPTARTLPKGTTTTELVYDQGVQPGNKYTLKASCVSNGVESDATYYFLASVPAPVTRVEPIIPGHDSVHMTIHKPAGTVSSVEISCFGPSIGALNGCTFPKSGFFNGNTYNVTYDKLYSDQDYTFTIKAVSNAKKSAPKVVTVRTTEGRSGPPSHFTASVQSSTSVKLEWKTPTDPNGVITSYVTEYTGTYKANPFLNLPADNGKVAFNNIDPSAGSYVRTIDGLKGGYQYDFVIYGKTTYQGPGENAATSVTMPTAAPTLAADAVAPQGTGEADKTSITALFSKAFNEPILYYSVIVAENRNGAALSSASIPDDTVSTWKQVKNISEDWPPYMAIRHCNIFDSTKNCQGSPANQRKKRSTSNDTVVITIGVQDCENKGKGDYCNGALKPDTYYQIRLRGYTGENKYSDTDYSQRIPTGSPNAVHEAIAIGVSVTAVVILVIAIIVPVVVIVKRRKQNKGAEHKQRPQAEVTVENSAFADIYDELTEPPQAPVKETAVMSMVTRYLPSADSEAREKLQTIFARLGVEGVSDLTYVKESDVVPPLTVIQARMFIEKVQEQEKKGSLDDVIYQEATVHPDQASAAVYLNVRNGLAISDEAAKSQTSEYASLQGYVKPDQNTYDQLSGVLRK